MSQVLWVTAFVTGTVLGVTFAPMLGLSSEAGIMLFSLAMGVASSAVWIASPLPNATHFGFGSADEQE